MSSTLETNEYDLCQAVLYVINFACFTNQNCRLYAHVGVLALFVENLSD